jgi:hypothetical protein
MSEHEDIVHRRAGWGATGLDHARRIALPTNSSQGLFNWGVWPPGVDSWQSADQVFFRLLSLPSRGKVFMAADIAH